jgi:tripartite-type tricarboxylate transporter receptor subunit TctC
MRASRFLCVVAGALLAAGSGLAGSAWAQDYPTRPVRVLNGFPPGGATEAVGRVVMDHLTKAFGKPFYLEPKPGAAGNLAGELLANAPPDGHTLYLAAPAVVAVNPEMYKNMTFDPAKAFAPITLIARLPIFLEVSVKHPPTSYKEFIAFAKAAGGALNHGSPGVGTSMHLAAELLKSRVGFKSEHITYRGQSAFAQAMMQKELDWAFDVPVTAMNLAQNGHVRLLAVTGEKRDPRHPSVPTLTELGEADAIWLSWFALVAPAGTPKPILERIAVEVANGYRDPETAGRVTATGMEAFATTPEETARIFAADRARWGKVVRDNKIVAE